MIIAASLSGQGAPPLSPLTAEEIAHYRWLIGGLLNGSFVLASRECAELSSVPHAIDHARDLFDELIARIPSEEDA